MEEIEGKNPRIENQYRQVLKQFTRMLVLEEIHDQHVALYDKELPPVVQKAPEPEDLKRKKTLKE